jgi:hypothetical protein
VVIGLGFAAALRGGLIGWLALKPLRPVTVVVRNESEKSITTVRLEHERGVETVENIARGTREQSDSKGRRGLLHAARPLRRRL